MVSPQFVAETLVALERLGAQTVNVADSALLGGIGGEALLGFGLLPSIQSLF